MDFRNLEQMDQDARLTSTVEQAGAGALIRQLPRSWETPLSRIWSDGLDLSLGQWQRLAVARAIFRDAQVVVMDEPTASLDPRAEARFFAQVARVTAGKTAFFVSHRLGMARLADRFLVMKDGRHSVRRRRLTSHKREGLA